ncbi:pantoate--beta-alanine ligase [Candidatus Thioglobus sp.]|nr:pantoate--beta-alanine ligase [Candidatus Thioglobus sp.]
MKIFERSGDLQVFLDTHRSSNKKVALVPTMGGLHDGHLRLVEKAQSLADVVVVSVFVNPTQFAKDEDFDSYPKTFSDDKLLLEDQSVDALFIPSKNEIYPNGTLSNYDVGEMGGLLCGVSRPAHFNGVAQVVNRLFDIVNPNYSVFGEKDYQQLLIIKSLVENNNLNVLIESVSTQREIDGLAMSTRNKYLGNKDRQKAPFFYQQLRNAKMAIEQGDSTEFVMEKTLSELRVNFEVEYLEILNANNLTQIATNTSEIIIISAIRLGETRLIDNIVFRRPNV